MALVAELVTKVTAETSEFTRGMAQVVAAATAASVAIFAAVDHITDKIDTLGKTAEKLGIDFESFQSLSYAATIANVPIEKLQLGMTRLARTMYDAANGNQEAALAFSKLGLNIKELQGLELDKVYERVGDAIAKVSNKNEQLALSVKIFGKGGADNLLLFRHNVTELVTEFDKLGITLTESQRAASEGFQDTKKKLESLLGGIASQVAADVAPAFTVLMESISENIIGIGNLKEASRGMASGVIGAVQIMVSAFQGFLTVLDAARNSMDFIITDLGNAGQRLGLVGKAIAAGTTDPTVIGTLKPTDRGVGSNLAGSFDFAGLQSKLDAQKAGLNGTILQSFIVPIGKAGEAVQDFATAISKATSQTQGLIDTNSKAGVSEELTRILGNKLGNNNATLSGHLDGPNAVFDDKVNNIFDSIKKSGNSDEIQSMITSARSDAPTLADIGVINDLQKFSEESKKPQKLDVTITLPQGFNGTIAGSPEIKAVIKNGFETLLASGAASSGQ